MHVLIIEDEPKVAAFIKQGLTECGYVADVAGDGEEGLQMALSTEYDMVLLDLMLPKRDGWSVIAELRRRGTETPVIMLTALDGMQDRVRGLELGADDYVAKPFGFSELLARIKTVLRRGPTLKQDVLQVADLELNVHAHRATRGGKRLDLTPKEFALLSLLMHRSGEVMSRVRIAERIWNIRFETESNVVDVHMRRLRAKVDDPYEVKLIHTVRGSGYVLEVRPE
ncbi:heavy metal response regulator transcription factor [Geomonas agri]|uniref:heavy metal response regulator transcription factor n=1 Tax=Geomonas agri TaxID=2873702 RepID=UPI001CD4FA37|nr:heavy metal response regulator transcription factor [Geomonas agri]